MWEVEALAPFLGWRSFSLCIIGVAGLHSEKVVGRGGVTLLGLTFQEDLSVSSQVWFV